MAYTKFHAIKSTLNKALDYIENPSKTEGQLLVTGYNVDPLTASIEYRMTAALAKEAVGDYTNTGGANVLAYHMIQSFSPDDTLTPEQAHQIGKQWADEILQGKYEYVISTHVDKGHIHNHIIFNAISFYDHRKYETKPYKTVALLRRISDRLCEAQGLSIVKAPSQTKSATHYEYEQRKAGRSWKAQLKDLIDNAIQAATDYNSFLDTLAKYNVEVKEGQRISFRIVGSGQERFCRGDRIGADYSRDKIIERIQRGKKEVAVSANQTYDKKVEWEAQRTTLAATKELAAALVTIRAENIHQESDFDLRIDYLSEQAANVKATIIDLSQKAQQYKNAAKYLLAFHQHLKIKQDYEKQIPITRRKYATRWESELKAFEHAASQLEKMGVNTNVDPEKVLALIKDQEIRMDELSSMTKDTTKRIDAIRQARQVVEAINRQLDIQGQAHQQGIRKETKER